MIVAKEVKYLGGNTALPVIHFYGDGAHTLGKQFPKMIENDHPLNVLISMGFEPISNKVWVKRNNLTDE